MSAGAEITGASPAGPAAPQGPGGPGGPGSPSGQSGSAPQNATNLEASVIQMKVLTAARSSHGPEELEAIGKLYNIAEVPGLLPVAVEDAPLSTVQYVVGLYLAKGRSLNETGAGGNTPLHLAIIENRRDVAAYLVSLPEIDDTIANKEGVLPNDLATDPLMDDTLSHAQQRFVTAMALRLRTAFQERNLPALEKIYSTPRVSELLDINGRDPDTGATVLHQAAASGDLKLVQFILAHGGDPLAHNAQGKLPGDLTKREDIVRVLNNAAKSHAIMIETRQARASGSTGPGAQAPELSGFLKKWTNLTGGYKLRWFTLRNGTLSYYKRREDANSERNVRGSLALRHAHVRLDSSEQNKFEVRTANTKFHLKAGSPSETSKWVWALQNAITFAKDYDKSHNKRRHQRSTSQRSAASVESARSARPSVPSTPTVPSSATATSATAATTTTTTTSAATTPISKSPSRRRRGSSEALHKQVSRDTAASSEDLSRATSSGTANAGLFVNDLANTNDDDDDDIDSSDDDDDGPDLGPPVSVDRLIGQVAAIYELLNLMLPKASDPAFAEAVTTAQSSLKVLRADLERYSQQAKRTSARHTAQFERSEKAQRIWATNYRDLEIQFDRTVGKLEALKLSTKTEDSDDEFFDAEGGFEDHGHGSRATVQDPDVPPTIPEVPQETERAESQQSSESVPSSGATGSTEGVVSSGITTSATATAGAGAGGVALAAAATRYEDSKSFIAPGQSQQQPQQQQQSFQPPQALQPPQPPQQQQQEQQPPQYQENEQLRQQQEKQPEKQPRQEKSQVPSDPHETSIQHNKQEYLVNENSWAGYEDPPRQKLKIDADNRPRLSLWGILKNLIGKDMTKMTLPVTFNECTSLLQRSAEDMEYTDLLDKSASCVDDPGLRMAYVMAFAASSYSSTINRVAKPFNPLLGETYEYARPDRGYRMFAEQVSHHPPIGALMAESKRWDFYGESNVDSHFYGRSFDINPLGIWYLNLRPDAGADVDSELYSFRKITSSVVGIMIGNPVVDNYGKMEIVNHTTGLVGEIDFKPRGWRASSAYRLSGVVRDRSGKELWAIKGTWSEEISARKLGEKESKPIRLWHVHDRQPEPFNLTAFAITLNALPDSLRSWLPPTDTRLRPDQRAMEEGRYDDASDEKARVEDKQRKARRLREANNEEYRPKWFESVVHPVTGKNYYKPINDYWGRRAEHGLADAGDIF